MTSATQYKTLILIKDKDSNEYIDKTSEISSYEKTRTGYTVLFKNTSKPYNFNYDRISVYGSPKVVKTESAVVTVNSKIVENIDVMIEFDTYIKIFYKRGKTELHNINAVKIETSCLEEPRVQELKQYLVAISSCANRMEGQDSFLAKELENIAFISDETVFADYSLGKTSEFDKTSESGKKQEVLVFPFGINKSQKIAVEIRRRI